MVDFMSKSFGLSLGSAVMQEQPELVEQYHDNFVDSMN